MKVVFVVALVLHSCIIGGGTTSIVHGKLFDDASSSSSHRRDLHGGEEGDEIAPLEDDFASRKSYSNSKNKNSDFTDRPEFFLRSSQNKNINVVNNNNNDYQDKKIKIIDDTPPLNNYHRVLIEESTELSTDFTIRSLLEEADPAVLSIDDGTLYRDFAFAEGVEGVFLNRFQATTDVNYITGIQLAFTTRTPTDHIFDIILYSDPDPEGGGSLTGDAEELARENDLLTPSAIASGEFVEYFFSNPVSLDVGQSFFAGLVFYDRIYIGGDLGGGDSSWSATRGSDPTAWNTIINFAPRGFEHDLMIRAVYREPPSSTPSNTPSGTPSSAPSFSGEPSSIPSTMPSSFPSSPPSLSDATAVLSIDDGTLYRDFAFAEGVEGVFLNRFQATTDVNYITGIQLAFTTRTPTDHIFDIILYSDPDPEGGGSLTGDAEELARENDLLTPSAIASGEFVEYFFSNPVSLDVGQSFFAGLVFYDRIYIGGDLGGGDSSWSATRGSDPTAWNTIINFAPRGFEHDLMIRAVYREPPSSTPSSSPSPSSEPSSLPSSAPSFSSEPSSIPSSTPSISSAPSSLPSSTPSLSSEPSSLPSSTPSLSSEPSSLPSSTPSLSSEPSSIPSSTPSLSSEPSSLPSSTPSHSSEPSSIPSSTPSLSREPSFLPSSTPSLSSEPSSLPSDTPSLSSEPSSIPSSTPSLSSEPSSIPSSTPSLSSAPSCLPSSTPSLSSVPSSLPSSTPSLSSEPSSIPSSTPSLSSEPSSLPSSTPSLSSSPSSPPSNAPSLSSLPSLLPSSTPSFSSSPSSLPSSFPSLSSEPSSIPSSTPTLSSSPSSIPSSTPSFSSSPSSLPSSSPSLSSSPSSLPSSAPSISSAPSSIPSGAPSLSSEPSSLPSSPPSLSIKPSMSPSTSPSSNPTYAGPCPLDRPCFLGGNPLTRRGLFGNCIQECELLDSTARLKLQDILNQDYKCGYCPTDSPTPGPSPFPTPAPSAGPTDTPSKSPGPTAGQLLAPTDETQSYCEPDPRCNAGQNPMYRPGSLFRRCEDDCVDSNFDAQTLDFFWGGWRCGSC